jgi:hypothetical protein
LSGFAERVGRAFDLRITQLHGEVEDIHRTQELELGDGSEELHGAGFTGLRLVAGNPQGSSFMHVEEDLAHYRYYRR